MTQKPDWWPENPYPASAFPMAEERYPEIVPDPELRTALSGMLGRQFWNIASDTIWAATLETVRELDVTNKLLKERDRVMQAIPPCPWHGHQCVPHALLWIEVQKRAKETNR